MMHSRHLDSPCVATTADMPFFFFFFLLKVAEVKLEAGPLPWQDMNHRGKSLHGINTTTAVGRDEHAHLCNKSMWTTKHARSPSTGTWDTS